MHDLKFINMLKDPNGAPKNGISYIQLCSKNPNYTCTQDFIIIHAEPLFHMHMIRFCGSLFIASTVPIYTHMKDYS